MTPEEVTYAIENEVIPQYQEHLSKTGFVPALKAGARSFIAGTEETLGFPEAGAEQRKKAEETYQPFTDADLEAAKQRGILDTVGAYKTKYLTEPLGNIAGRYGAPVVAGMLAPEAGVGVIGGAALRGLAGTAVDIGAEKAENIQAQINAGKQPEEAKAWLAALPQALLAGFGFPGTSQVNKLLSPKLFAEAEALAPKVIAGETTLAEAKAALTSKTQVYLTNMGINTASGAGLMIGTEDIRRAQAGQDLMSGSEMLESTVQAGILSPIFGLLHPSQRSKAEAVLTDADRRNKVVESINNERKQRDIDIDNYKKDAVLKENLEKQAELIKKRNEESKTFEERISYFFPDKKSTSGKSAKDMQVALNEPSGVMVSDPITGQERELTMGEHFEQKYPDLFPKKEVKAPVLNETILTSLLGDKHPSVKALNGLDLSKGAEREYFDTVIDKIKSSLSQDQKNKLDDFVIRLPTLEMVDATSALQKVIESGKEFTNPSEIKNFLSKEYSKDQLTSLLQSNKKVFKDILNDYRQSKSEPTTDGTSVSGVDVGQLKDTTRIEGDNLGTVDNAGNDIGRYTKGEGQQPAPLAKTTTEVLKSAEQLTPEEPTPVIPDEPREILTDETRATKTFVQQEPKQGTYTGKPPKGDENVGLPLKPTSLMDRLQDADPAVRYDARIELSTVLREQRNIERSLQESELLKKTPKGDSLVNRANRLADNLPKERVDLIDELRDTMRSPKQIKQSIDKAKKALVDARIDKLVTNILHRKPTPEEVAAFEKLQNDMFRYEPKRLGKNKESVFAKDPEAFNSMIDAYIDESSGRTKKADPIIDESRVPGSKPTGQTKESIMYRLKGMFGSGIDSLTKRGVLNIVNSVAELPKQIQEKIGADAIGAHSEGKAYLIADRLAPEKIRSVILHEIGEHYGLEALIGERNYKDVLQSVMAGKDKDAVIKAAWEHVSTVYPELKIGERQFLREIVAKIGEDAPSHPLWRRILNAVRNFLKQNKYKNMSGEDIQDLVMNSFKTAMKRDLRIERTGIETQNIGKFNTEAFKRWFGNSKLVNADGTPLTLYHGTGQDVRAFKLSKDGSLGAGIYLTPKADFASGYAQMEGGNVVPVYARLENPLVIRTEMGKSDPMIEALVQLGVDRTKAENIVEKAYEDKGYITKEVMSRAQKQGYDGLVQFKNGELGEVVAFSPNQIKSATGNKGTFDLSRPEIEFAKRKQEPNPEFKVLFEKAGGIYDKVEEPTLFQSLKDDPVNYVKERAKGAPKFLDKLETMLFSSDASLQNALRKGMEDMGMPFDKIKDMLFRASTSQALHREAIAHQVLVKGGLKYDPETFKYVAIDKPGSWKGVVEALKAAAEENGFSYEEMEKYAHQALIGRRLRGIQINNDTVEKRYVAEMAKATNATQRAAAESRFEKDHKIVHLTEAQLKASEDLFKKVKGMDKIVDEWNKSRENILDFAVESGLYTKSEAQDLLDVMDYVPFYRVEQLEDKAGPKEFNRGLLDIAKDPRFRGSKDPVNNVFDNMERWISYVVRKGVGNQSAKDLNEAAMKYLPGEVTKLNPNEKVPHGMRGNIVGIWSNGSVDKYVYKDPLFVHAFTGMEPIVIPALSAASKFTNLLRQNIVLNPLFSIGQLSQDAFGAMFASGVKHPFAIPVQVLKEFIGTLRGTSEAHNILIDYGAVGRRDYSSDVSRIDAEVAAGLKEPSLYDKATKPFRALSMASDNAVRQAIYNQTMKETGNKALAIERAFEIINFRRAGASSTVNFLRQTVPFFGAYLQSMNVAAKVIAGKGIAPMEKAEARKVLASTFAKVMVAGFIYNVLISEDEDYKKLDPSVRDRKLLGPGMGGMSIPLRMDIFTVASKVLPEHIYQMTMAQGTEDATKAKRSLYNAMGNALLGPNVLPQFAKPAIEVITNHNFFTDRPIVGQYEQTLDPDKQYSANTSELSKVFGSVSNTSPMKWDHLFKAYFGYTAGLGLMFTDQLISAGSNKPLPDKSFQDTVASVPGMSAFYAKEFGTREKNDFYELRDLVDRAVSSSNYLKTYGTQEEKTQYKEENKQLIQVKAQVNNINRQLASIRKQERLVYEAPNTKMSTEQKAIRIKGLREQEEKALRNVSAIRKRAGL